MLVNPQEPPAVRMSDDPALLLVALHAQARTGVVIGMQLEPADIGPHCDPAAAISEILYGNVFEGLCSLPATVRRAQLAALGHLGRRTDLPLHLRHGVHFHDGSVFDSAIVKFSLDRAREPGS